MKYVAIIEYFPNCRVHDGGSPAEPFFFNTLDELKLYVLLNLHEYAVHSIYECETGLLACFDVYYDLSSHSAVGAKIKGKALDCPWRLVDDGHGKKIWQCE